MFGIFFKTVRDLAFVQIEDARAGSLIHLKEANLEGVQRIAEMTNLDIADLRDSLDKYELPRVEHQGESVLLFLRHPSEEEVGLYTATLTIVLTNTYLIAISPGKSSIIDQLLTTKIPLATTQKSKLLLHILLKITQEFTSSIKRVRHAIVEHEQATKVIDSQSILVLTKNEEILNQYLTALVPLKNLLEALATGRFINLYEKDYDLLQDLMIAMRQSEDLCRVNVKSIRSLRDSYQIIFTNDVNRTIKRLTALTIIFTIPTIIASIYGMNVALPFASRGWAFGAILFTTVFLSILAIALFRRNRWL